MTEVLRMASSRKVVAHEQDEVSNIVQLFEALGVGWVDGGRNRSLIASHRHSFIRVSPPNANDFSRPNVGDIPVVVRNHGYSMRGFIKFEAPMLYRGMFKVAQAFDGDWHSAELTADGYRFAQVAVFDVARLHRDIANCPFFNPPARDAGADLMLRNEKEPHD